MGHEIIDIKKKNHFKTWRLSKNSVVPLTLNYISECIVHYPHRMKNIGISLEKFIDILLRLLIKRAYLI